MIIGEHCIWVQYRTAPENRLGILFNPSQHIFGIYSEGTGQAEKLTPVRGPIKSEYHGQVGPFCLAWYVGSQCHPYRYELIARYSTVIKKTPYLVVLGLKFTTNEWRILYNAVFLTLIFLVQI